MTDMAYQSRPADVIKSVRQRWLYQYWLRLRGDRDLPPWSDLDAAELDSCFDDLTILDVLASNGGTRFRIHNHGKNVGAMYAGQCAGKYLDEVLPASARVPTLETYEHAARTRQPVYTVSSVVDAGARPILYERLLLPFSDGGRETFRVIGFLETISSAGAFDRQQLMTDPKIAAGYALKVVVRPRSGFTDVRPT
jgi:hypothetical protein